MKSWRFRIGAWAAALLLPMMLVVVMGGGKEAPPPRNAAEFQNQLTPGAEAQGEPDPDQEATQGKAEAISPRPHQVVYHTKNVEMILAAPHERPLPPGSIILPPDAEEAPSDMLPDRDR